MSVEGSLFGNSRLLEDENTAERKPAKRPKNVRRAIIGAAVGVLAVAGIGANQTVVSTETTERIVPCERKTQDDPELPKGETSVIQSCVDGVEEIVSEVKTRRGKEISREVKSTRSLREAVAEITSVGTLEVEAQDVTPDIQPTATQNAEPIVYELDQEPTQSPSQELPSQETQDAGYSDAIQDGYCKDGTPVRGNPHAVGRANVCYGHKGWVGN